MLSGHQGYLACQAFSKRQYYILIFKFIRALAILRHCNYNTDRAHHTTDSWQGTVSGSRRTFQHQQFLESHEGGGNFVWNLTIVSSLSSHKQHHLTLLAQSARHHILNMLITSCQFLDSYSDDWQDVQQLNFMHFHLPTKLILPYLAGTESKIWIKPQTWAPLLAAVLPRL